VKQRIQACKGVNNAVRGIVVEVREISQAFVILPFNIEVVQKMNEDLISVGDDALYEAHT
jgi:hypothetical protein